MGEESLDALKIRVQRAMPAADAAVAARHADKSDTLWQGNRGWAKDPERRAWFYGSATDRLPDSRGKYWFAAAAKVAGTGGIRDLGRADGKFLGPILTPISKEGVAAILAGNAFLFPYNMLNFYTLLHRKEIPGLEGLRDYPLDRALVVFEQTLVARFLDSHFAQPALAGRRTELAQGISKSFTSVLAGDDVKTIIEAKFGKQFDFSSIDHRITLGIAVVRFMRRLPW
jgi:hypothetical protein